MRNRNKPPIFVKQPTVVISDTRISHAAKSVYSLLVGLNNAKAGGAFPSQKRISEYLGICERQVSNLIKQLKKLGLIKTVPRTLDSNGRRLRDPGLLYIITDLRTIYGDLVDMNLTNLSKSQVPWNRKYSSREAKHIAEGHTKRSSGGVEKQFTAEGQNISSDSYLNGNANELDLDEEELEEDRISRHTQSAAIQSHPIIKEIPLDNSRKQPPKTTAKEDEFELETEIIGRIHNELLDQFNLMAEITFTKSGISKWKKYLLMVDNQKSFSGHTDLLEMAILLVVHSIKHWEDIKLENYKIGLHPGPGLFAGDWFSHLVSDMIERDSISGLAPLATSIICSRQEILTLVQAYIEIHGGADLRFLLKCFSDDLNDSDHINWNGNENEMKGGGVKAL